MADAPGIGTYLRNMIPLVVRARPDWQFRLIGHSDVIDGLGWRAYENVNVVDCRAPIYTVREQVALWRLPGGAVDAFWSPHYNIPLTQRAPLVVTVHDVIHLARPEYTGRPIKQLYARAMFEMARRRAAAIITSVGFHTTRVRASRRAAGGADHRGAQWRRSLVVHDRKTCI